MGDIVFRYTQVYYKTGQDMTQKKAQPKKKTTAKKSAATKSPAKKTPAKTTAAKKVPAKKPGRPAKVKVEENVIKIDDLVELTISPEVIEKAYAEKATFFKKFLSFLKK